MKPVIKKRIKGPPIDESGKPDESAKKGKKDKIHLDIRADAPATPPINNNVQLTKGHKYHGAILNDKPCGLGVMKSINGNTGIAYWDDRKPIGSYVCRHPKGVFEIRHIPLDTLCTMIIFPDGQVITVPEAKNDHQAEAYACASFTCKNGAYYGPVTKEHKRHGIGIVKYNSGVICITKWNNNQASDQVLLYRNGDIKFINHLNEVQMEVKGTE